MSLVATASAGPVQGDSLLLSEAERDFLSDLGVNVADVVEVSYAQTCVENSFARSAAEQKQVDVLQFATEEDGIVSSTSVMFTDADGMPLPASSVMDHGVVSSGSDTINYMSATVTYRLYGDIMSGIYVNPRSVTMRSSVASSNVSVAYRASGPCYRMTGSDPVLVSGTTSATITANYTSMAANTGYTANGDSFYNGYAISQDTAIQIGVYDSESHGVSATYTAAGRYYNTSFPFLIYT